MARAAGGSSSCKKTCGRTSHSWLPRPASGPPGWGLLSGIGADAIAAIPSSVKLGRKDDGDVIELVV